MLRGEDLVRVAELIILGARTARSFNELAVNGEFSRIADATKRIETAAKELMQVGRELERRMSRTS